MTMTLPQRSVQLPTKEIFKERVNNEPEKNSLIWYQTKWNCG